jgi:hypothetical protein
MDLLEALPPATPFFIPEEARHVSGFFRLLAASRQSSIILDRCCAEGCGVFKLFD